MDISSNNYYNLLIYTPIDKTYCLNKKYLYNNIIKKKKESDILDIENILNNYENEVIENIIGSYEYSMLLFELIDNYNIINKHKNVTVNKILNLETTAQIIPNNQITYKPIIDDINIARSNNFLFFKKSDLGIIQYNFVKNNKDILKIKQYLHLELENQYKRLKNYINIGLNSERNAKIIEHELRFSKIINYIILFRMNILDNIVNKLKI